MKSLEQKIDIILQRTYTILRILEKKKEPANVRFLPATEGLEEERQSELLRMFEKLCGLNGYQKEIQSFPKEIRPIAPCPANNFTTTVPRIVPYSVLKNRCQLRKAFRPRDGESDSGAVFEQTIDRSKLVVNTLHEAGLREYSDIRCVWDSKNPGPAAEKLPERVVETTPKKGFRPDVPLPPPTKKEPWELADLAEEENFETVKKNPWDAIAERKAAREAMAPPKLKVTFEENEEATEGLSASDAESSEDAFNPDDLEIIDDEEEEA